VVQLLDELSSVGASIRVPELRDIRLTRRVRSVIDHPDFQRLRRVRQLGPTHWVYPGAMHTRFEHSIGVYGVVQDFLRSLLQRPAFRDAVCEQDLLAVLAGGLLHDIGHYPYAHSLEALHRRGSETPRHEDLVGPILKRGISAILEQQWGVDSQRVIRLIQVKRDHQPNQVDKILASILSSAIDADKLDYLQRDSLHLGVPYGRSFDANRLIASLRLNEDEDGTAIDAKGRISAEMFIFSRYMMFSEAYWHHTVRSACAMVEAALGDHLERRGSDPQELADDLLARSDDELIEWVRALAPAGSLTSRLLLRMTGDHRQLYKRLATYSRSYAEEEKRQAYERLYSMDADELARVTVGISEVLSRRCGTPVAPGDVLIDTPPRDKDHHETVDVCYGNVRGRRAYPLHEISRIVSGVHTDFVHVVKKIRIFVTPEIAERARTTQHAIEEAILEVIQ
jgi:HD superfamily phosphohydrolase